MNYTYYVIYDPNDKIFVEDAFSMCEELLDAQRFLTIQGAADTIDPGEDFIIQMVCVHAIIACDIERPEKIHLKADVEETFE